MFYSNLKAKSKLPALFGFFDRNTQTYPPQLSKLSLLNFIEQNSLYKIHNYHYNASILKSENFRDSLRTWNSNSINNSLLLVNRFTPYL